MECGEVGNRETTRGEVESEGRRAPLRVLREKAGERLKIVGEGKSRNLLNVRRAVIGVCYCCWVFL